MLLEPAIHDHVTVLDATGRLLVHARWGGHRDEYKSFVDAYHVYRTGIGGRVRMPDDVRLADEGITWCRGHMSEKDDEGKAMLAGAALKDNRLPTDVRETLEGLLEKPRALAAAAAGVVFAGLRYLFQDKTK